MTDNLYYRIALAANKPKEIFIEQPGGKSISYAETFERSARFAHVLAQNGVLPGDRVAVQIQKSPQALFLYLACLRIGAVFLPLNTDYTLSELSYFIRDAEPKLFVCSHDMALKLAKECLSTELLTIDNWGQSGSFLAQAETAEGNAPIANLCMQDLACILYTSGTTGRSKGAMLSHENLHSNAQSLSQVWHFCSSDVLLHALPVFHTHGLFVATNVTLLSAARMIFLRKFDLDDVFNALARATVMMGIPTYYTRMLKDERLNPQSAKHMRLFISGSAPLSVETHRHWRLRTGHAILERYGMTETNMNASNPYHGPRIAGSVGRPLPGVEIRIADSDGASLPNGQIGMIEVRGPNVFKGYWRMPEISGTCFRCDGYFITGDLGMMNDEGYIFIVGRKKDLIISGGLNVYPKEIEDVIDGIEGVAESAVVGVAHPDFGEGVTAFVIPKQGFALNERQVQETLTKKLARFKCPKRVIFLDQFPRNSMGKIQKNVMRERFSDLYRPCN